VPQGFNYQAVARNASGKLIANTLLPVRITIQSDSLGGTIFWQELHSSVTTTDQGVINLVLGKGVKQTGNATTFDDVDWSVTPKFIKTEVYYSSDWKTMGSSRLWSVPYAMIANDLQGSVKKLSVVGETSALDEALFVVKNKNGQIIFAVYNEGVRIYVDDGAKGTKGGFAVGGFDMTKLTKREYLVVTDDSIRMYIDSDPLTKGTKGGFAVGGFDMTKNPAVPFVSLSPKNYFIGHDAGGNITTGEYNCFLGFQSGKANKDGNYNIFIGHQSGYNTLGPSGAVGGSEGSNNCFIGYQAGYLNQYGANNTLIGYSSGLNNTSDHNTFLGSLSGYNNTSGYSNTFIGTSAGTNNTTGGYNVFLGRNAGTNVQDGNWNTCIGTAAGANIRTGQKNIVIGAGAMGENLFAGSGNGSSNIIIGFEAGYSAANTSSNIFIGNQAGYSETGSNKLIIENSSSSTPLVYGNFDTDLFTVNGNVEALTFNTVSDAALKQNITELTGVIEKLRLIRGVYFYWNQSEETELMLKEGRQIGVIAQEIENVFPELVKTNDRGYKMVDYSKLTPVLLEAVKEQQRQIESVKQENQQLKTELYELKALVNNLIANQSAQVNN
jgi:hypothetical protein